MFCFYVAFQILQPYSTRTKKPGNKEHTMGFSITGLANVHVLFVSQKVWKVL